MMIQNQICIKLLKKRVVAVIFIVIIAVEILFYYSPLDLVLLIKPLPSASLGLNTVSYDIVGDTDNSLQKISYLNYLHTKLSPRMYRYEVRLKEINELKRLNYVNTGYPSSLELWSMPDLSLFQTNLALRKAISQINISGEIFLPKFNIQSTMPVLEQDIATTNKAIICYFKLLGNLNKRLPNSYGLDLDLTEEYVGISYDYQIGVDKFGKVQYILPLSRMDTPINNTLIKALWQLPFEAVTHRIKDNIEWGRVKIEFDY